MLRAARESKELVYSARMVRPAVSSALMKPLRRSSNTRVVNSWSSSVSTHTAYRSPLNCAAYSPAMRPPATLSMNEESTLSAKASTSTVGCWVRRRRSWNICVRLYVAMTSPSAWYASVCEPR